MMFSYNEKNDMERIILLDLDGTIIDSYNSVLNAMERAYACLSLQVPSALYETKLVGDLLSLAFKKLPGNIEENKFKMLYDSLLNEDPLKGVYVSQCVFDTLNLMKRKGYKLVVLTNKNQQIAETICSELFPSDMFEAVIGRKTTKAIKPMFVKQELITHGINFEQLHCLIGDSETDRKTAFLLNIAYYDVNETDIYRLAKN